MESIHQFEDTDLEVIEVKSEPKAQQRKEPLEKPAKAKGKRKASGEEPKAKKQKTEKHLSEEQQAALQEKLKKLEKLLQRDSAEFKALAGSPVKQLEKFGCFTTTPDISEADLLVIYGIISLLTRRTFENVPDRVLDALAQGDLTLLCEWWEKPLVETLALLRSFGAMFPLPLKKEAEDAQSLPKGPVVWHNPLSAKSSLAPFTEWTQLREELLPALDREGFFMLFAGDSVKTCPGEKMTAAHFDKRFKEMYLRVQMAAIIGGDVGRLLWVLPTSKEAEDLLHEIFNVNPGFSTVENIKGLQEIIDTYSEAIPEGQSGLIAWTDRNLHGEKEVRPQEMSSQQKRKKFRACRVYCGFHYVDKKDKPKLLDHLIQMAYFRLVCEIDYASYHIARNKSQFDCVNNKSTQCYLLRQGVDERVVAALKMSQAEMKAALRACPTVTAHDLFLVGLLPHDLE
jgi:hypothetical protein